MLQDEFGNVKELMEYKPFGEFSRHDKFGTDEEVANYYFTGQYKDDESGLYFYNARYYNAKLGRFIQADTIVQNPGDSSTFNRYSYTSNNPINRIDPSGNSWLSNLFGGTFLGSLFNAFLTGDWKTFGITVAALVGGALFGGLGYAFANGPLLSFFGSGGISVFEGGLITGIEFGIGGFGAAFAGSLASGSSLSDAFSAGGLGFTGGFVVGFGVGASYTAGWQSAIHGVDTQKYNINKGLREAVELRNQGNLQAAFDIEQGLAKKYPLGKVVQQKHDMLKAMVGKHVNNDPAVFLVGETNMNGEVVTSRRLIDPRDGLPNYTEGHFLKLDASVSLDLAKNGVTDGMSEIYTKFYYTNMPEGYKATFSFSKFIFNSSYSANYGPANFSSSAFMFKGKVQ